jgi:intracellular multiplication protein IcmD
LVNISFNKEHNMRKLWGKQSKLGLALWAIGGVTTTAFAARAQSIGDLATNVQGTLGPIETMIIAVCYIGGVAFAGAAIMKFKQYKDNPQQVTLGQPIALLFIAAALIWLPQIVKTTGQTVFKDTSGAGGVKNTGIFQ